MKIDVYRTSTGLIRADMEIMGKTTFAQSDTIHGALRNLAFEVHQDPERENEQIAQWHRES